LDRWLQEHFPDLPSENIEADISPTISDPEAFLGKYFFPHGGGRPGQNETATETSGFQFSTGQHDERTHLTVARDNAGSAQRSSSPDDPERWLEDKLRQWTHPGSPERDQTVTEPADFQADTRQQEERGLSVPHVLDMSAQLDDDSSEPATPTATSGTARRPHPQTTTGTADQPTPSEATAVPARTRLPRPPQQAEPRVPGVPEDARERIKSILPILRGDYTLIQLAHATGIADGTLRGRLEAYERNDSYVATRDGRVIPRGLLHTVDPADLVDAGAAFVGRSLRVTDAQLAALLRQWLRNNSAADLTPRTRLTITLLGDYQDTISPRRIINRYIDENSNFIRSYPDPNGAMRHLPASPELREILEENFNIRFSATSPGLPVSGSVRRARRTDQDRSRTTKDRPGTTRDASATKSALIVMARELFATRHYKDVFVDEIATSAGVTTGTLYHHFGSKQGLYEAVAADVSHDAPDDGTTAPVPQTTSTHSLAQGSTADATRVTGVQRTGPSSSDPRIFRPYLPPATLAPGQAGRVAGAGFAQVNVQGEGDNFVDALVIVAGLTDDNTGLPLTSQQVRARLAATLGSDLTTANQPRWTEIRRLMQPDNVDPREVIQRILDPNTRVGLGRNVLLAAVAAAYDLEIHVYHGEGDYTVRAGTNPRPALLIHHIDNANGAQRWIAAVPDINAMLQSRGLWPARQEDQERALLEVAAEAHNLPPVHRNALAAAIVAGRYRIDPLLQNWGFTRATANEIVRAYQHVMPGVFIPGPWNPSTAPNWPDIHQQAAELIRRRRRGQ
jgi:AcrR family transcriptional regulator